MREQAAIWIARIDRGINPAERHELQQWLNDSPRHREILFEMSELWDRMDILSELSELFPEEPRAPQLMWRPGRPIAVALSCLAILLTILLGVWLKTGDLAVLAELRLLLPPKTVQAIYRTQIGQQMLVTLPDRSLLTLNTDTQVTMHYTQSDRMIELLQGEAHFKVAKDAKRVFTVRVGENQFKAVGTAFNLRKTSEFGVELTVMEGRVKVLVKPAKIATPSVPTTPTSAQARTILVDAGQELAIDPRAAQIVEDVQPARIETTVAWTHGMLVFDGEPLERVIREVSRYSTTHFVIADDDIKQIPVAGYFKVGDIDGLVAALESNFDIDASRDGNTIVLKAAHRP